MAVIKYRNETGEWVELSTIKGDAGKSPKVNPDTNTWMVWDDYTQAWVDSGVIAGIGNEEFDKSCYWVLNEVAEGKRKIAKAVKNKYEETTQTDSGVSEYSSFQELSDKISSIPVEVPLGSAMEQNGGVLPFYDVYNELVKASKTYTEYPYCCAMELDKWDYDNEHKVTLSGADAYYTSDGVYLKASELPESGEYQFTDRDKTNTNRFVVYFFGTERYSVPKSLPATSVFGLWCLKGTPLINFGTEYTKLLTVKVYDGNLEVADDNDCVLKNTALRFVNLPHIKQILGGTGIYNGGVMNIVSMGLENLTHLEAKSNLIGQGSIIKNLELPNLEYVMLYINVYLFMRLEEIYTLKFPKLKEIRSKSTTQTAFIYYSHNISLIELTALEVCEKLLMAAALKQGCKLVLGKPKGGNIVIGANNYLESITVEKGFASRLNISGCNSLSKEVLVDILNNLADLTGETSLNLIMGATLLAKLTDADKAIATQKNWTLS